MKKWMVELAFDKANRKQFPCWKVAYLKERGHRQLHVRSVKLGQVCQLREHRAICERWKGSLYRPQEPRHSSLFARHVSHSFRVLISRHAMKTCIICGLSDTSPSKRQSEVEGVCEEVILHLHLAGDGAMKDTGMVVPNLIQKLLLTDDFSFYLIFFPF